MDADLNDRRRRVRVRDENRVSFRFIEEVSKQFRWITEDVSFVLRQRRKERTETVRDIKKRHPRSKLILKNLC